MPNAETIDALISDKIVPSHWGRHLGHSSSSLVNASTWALMLTGKVLTHSDEHGLVNALHDVIRRLGEPVVRTAVTQAMRELGRQFVLGQTIEEAIENARPREEQGCVYSYDMLGEADRLDLSLDVIEAVLSDPALAGWDGFGIVVQTYGPRAGPVVD